MEITILEDKPNKIIFKVEGATNTVCNALKMELWEDSSVKIAGYNIDHPLVGVPKFVVETKKGTDVKKTISKALKGLSKKSLDLSKKSVAALK